MKKLILSMLAIATLTFTSCSDDNEENNNNGIILNENDLRGSLESGQEATLDPSKVYLLNGPFVIKDGAKLTIPA